MYSYSMSVWLKPDLNTPTQSNAYTAASSNCVVRFDGVFQLYFSSLTQMNIFFFAQYYYQTYPSAPVTVPVD